MTNDQRTTLSTAFLQICDVLVAAIGDRAAVQVLKLTEEMQAGSQPAQRESPPPREASPRNAAPPADRGRDTRSNVVPMSQPKTAAPATEKQINRLYDCRAQNRVAQIMRDLGIDCSYEQLTSGEANDILETYYQKNSQRASGGSRR